MRKIKTQGILHRKDLIGIAKVANLSESTMIKWYEKTLTVKPETELKIYEAASTFYQEEIEKLNDYLLKLAEVETRISETKSSIEQALQVLKAK
jgi:RNA recognition motif-containing protein